MSNLIANPGDVIRFEGCVWNDGWEFDAPLIIYAPVRRYCIATTVSRHAIWAQVEDLAIDLCVEPGGIRRDFFEDDLKEFAARGWSPRGFRRRKSAIHAFFDLRFFDDEDEGLSFDVLLGEFDEAPFGGRVL